MPGASLAWARVAVHHLPLWCAQHPRHGAGTVTPRPACSGHAPVPPGFTGTTTAAVPPHPWSRRPEPVAGAQNPVTGTGPSAGPGVWSRDNRSQHGAGHSFLWTPPATRHPPPPTLPRGARQRQPRNPNPGTGVPSPPGQYAPSGNFFKISVRENRSPRMGPEPKNITLSSIPFLSEENPSRTPPMM